MIEGALIKASIPGHRATKLTMSYSDKWLHLRDSALDSLDTEEVLTLIGCDAS